MVYVGELLWGLCCAWISFFSLFLRATCVSTQRAYRSRPQARLTACLSHVVALGQSEVIKPALTMSRSPDYSAIVKVNGLVEKEKKPRKNMPYFRKIKGICLLQLAHTNLRYTQWTASTTTMLFASVQVKQKQCLNLGLLGYRFPCTPCQDITPTVIKRNTFTNFQSMPSLCSYSEF